jgi:hypothetical protein
MVTANMEIVACFNTLTKTMIVTEQEATVPMTVFPRLKLATDIDKI